MHQTLTLRQPSRADQASTSALSAADTFTAVMKQDSRVLATNKALSGQVSYSLSSFKCLRRSKSRCTLLDNNQNYTGILSSSLRRAARRGGGLPARHYGAYVEYRRSIARKRSYSLQFNSLVLRFQIFLWTCRALRWAQVQNGLNVQF